MNRPARQRIGKIFRPWALAPATRDLIRDDLVHLPETGWRRLVGRQWSPDEQPNESPPAAPQRPIDAVITWVNPDDQPWRRALERSAPPGLTEQERQARFADHQELRFALRSIRTYAGWFRRVIVVTNRRPQWLLDHQWVSVILHDKLLPAECLPTFNSHAVESSLHHISGLAEHYVYFNDDFFLGRPVAPGLFFDQETGDALVAVSDARPPADPSEPGHYAAAHRTDSIVHELTGTRADRLLKHAPYPQLRSALMDLECLRSADFETTRSHQFRAFFDVSVAASLGPWYTIGTGRGRRATAAVDYVSVGHPLSGAKFRRLARTRDFDSFCLNWTAATGRRWDRRTVRFLERRFPDPAPWERDA